MITRKNFLLIFLLSLVLVSCKNKTKTLADFPPQKVSTGGGEILCNKIDSANVIAVGVTVFAPMAPAKLYYYIKDGSLLYRLIAREEYEGLGVNLNIEDYLDSAGIQDYFILKPHKSSKEYQIHWDRGKVFRLDRLNYLLFSSSEDSVVNKIADSVTAWQQLIIAKK